MKTALAGLCLALFASNLYADSVEAVLARMDKAAPEFHGLTAHVDMVEYQKIIDDKQSDPGTLQMQRNGKQVRAVLTFKDRVLGFLGNTLRVYLPQLNTYQDYDIAKHSDILNQFLLLGFGSSGKELAQSYEISLKGSEKVSGQDTSELVLIPKDPKVKEHLTQIYMWIPVDGANPVQQQFFEPSGNWRKVTYSDIVINPKMRGTLELKLPSGATKQG